SYPHTHMSTLFPYTTLFRSKRTPLFSSHVKAGARMVPFGGWEMPVQYTSILEEHRTVRRAIGLFDISHMGEFEVSGPAATAAVRSDEQTSELQSPDQLVCRL